MAKEKAEKEESNKRAAESARALAKAGIGLAASVALGPVGGLAVGGPDRLWEHARGGVWERRQRRVKQFHEALLAGIPADKQRALLARIESDADATAEGARMGGPGW